MSRTSHDRFPPPREFRSAPVPYVEIIPGHLLARFARLPVTARVAFCAEIENAAQRGQPPDGIRVPLVEPDPDGDSERRAVTFLHWAPLAEAVALSANALVDHSNVARSEFERLPGRGLWALTYRMPVDWEAGYRITAHRGPGPAPWRVQSDRRSIRLAMDTGGPDLLNPTSSAGMAGGALSTIRLPGAPAAPWLAAPSPDIRAGAVAMGHFEHVECNRTPLPRLETMTLLDSMTGSPRDVWLYRPPGRAAAGPTPLLVLHDGQVWARYLNLAATLDNAIAGGVIPPLHAALVDSHSVEARARDIGGPVGTVDFIANDLVPLLRDCLPVRGDARGTIASGASYGGLASLWQVARFPEVVGIALAQSPSLWRYDLSGPLAQVCGDVVIRLQAGIYEGEVHAGAHALCEALAPLGTDIALQSVTGGHDWAWWAPWLIHGLATLMV